MRLDCISDGIMTTEIKTKCKKWVYALICCLVIVCISLAAIACGGKTDDNEEPDEPTLASITISNKADLTKMWLVGDDDRTVTIELAPDSFTTENTTVTLTSDNISVVSVDGMKLRARAAGTAVITATAGGKSDTVTVTVSPKAEPLTTPTLTVDSTLNMLSDTDFDIPLTAIGSDGTDLKSKVVVTCEDATLDIDGLTINAATYGKQYTVKLTLTDDRITDTTVTKTVEKTTTVTVYRKLIDSSSIGLTTDLYKADAEQTLTVNSDGLALAKFDMPASKLYYAEATFTLEDQGFATNDDQGAMIIGLSHSAEDASVRRLTSAMRLGYNGYDPINFMAHMQMFNDDTSLLDWDGNSGVFIRNIQAYRGIVGCDEDSFKIAVARVNEYFYMFVNDKYVAAVTNKEYRDVNTVPGIIGTSKLNTATISDVTYYGGSEVEQKVNTLMNGGAAYIGAYVPADWATGSINTDNRRFTVGDVSAEKGINFTTTTNDVGFNDGMVSPYVFLDGDFTFSWTYKNTSYSESADQPRMILEARPYTFGDEVVQFGTDRKTGKYLLNTTHGVMGDADDLWHEYSYGENDAQGATYTISRKLLSDRAVFTITVTPVSDPEAAVTRTFDWNGTNWKDPMIMLWHNLGASGEFTNVTWSFTAPAYVESVTITNKTALTAEWLVGDADRTVIADIVSYGDIEATVTTDNASVISVDGMNLTAVGKGTATITVTAGGKTDSVIITVIDDSDPLETPTLTITEVAGGGTLNVLDGVATTLTVNAEGSDGANLVAHVTLSADSDELASGNLTLNGLGITAKYGKTYTVTVILTDDRITDASVTKTVEISFTVAVYRNMLASQNNTLDTDLYKTDAEQTLTVNTDGLMLATLNMTASKQYYAEATFTLEGQASVANGDQGAMIIGLSHSAANDEVRRLSSALRLGRNGHDPIDFTAHMQMFNDASSMLDWDGNNGVFIRNLQLFRGIADCNADIIKIAVARINEYFYMFVNDKYVAAVANSYYRNIDTIPGFIGTSKLNTATISNVTYYGGEEVGQKVNTLMNEYKAFVQAYVPDTFGNGSINTDNRRFTAGDYTAEKGINFTTTTKDNGDFNGGMISPYVFFDGDFTFSWTYKNTDADIDNVGEPRMVLEARPCNYSDSVVAFGTDRKTGKYLLNTPAGVMGDSSDQWHEYEYGENDAQGATYTISRKLLSDRAVFTITVTPVSDPEAAVTRTFDWNGSNWDKPMVMLWHNTGVSGEYTNVTWSLTAPEVTA